MTDDDFVGRDAETRAVLDNVNLKRSTMIIGGAGIGKSALLRELAPSLEAMGTYLPTTRVGPGFTGFLRELFEGLWHQTALPGAAVPAAGGRPRQGGLWHPQTLAGVPGADADEDLRDALRAWGRRYPSNDLKARWLIDRLEGIRIGGGNAIVVIDDAQGVTPGNRPWLERLTEVATVVAAVDPVALAKAGSKRFWKRFAEVRLEALGAGDARSLLERLIARYRVTADEPEIYRRRVLELAQGNPFELERLVKHHSAEALVRSRELGHLGQGFVERDVKQLALAPLLTVGGALAIAGRYVARAQGDLDMYVLSGIGIAAFVMVRPLFRGAMRPRSRT